MITDQGKIRVTKYFPAVSAALSSYLLKPIETFWADKDVHNLKGVNFKFYQPESIIGHHPYILFSAAHHFKIDQLRERGNISDDTMVFADSGGFQLLTGVISEKVFNEEIAYNWCEKHADIFPILDRPVSPYDREKDANHPDYQDHRSKFLYCLNKTKFAAEYYYRRWKESNNKKIILNVFSSSEWKGREMNEWYEQVIEPYHFGHYAHGRHLGNMRHILEVFFFLLNQGEFKRSPGPHYYHLLGVSTPKMMLYLAYMQRLLNEHDIDVQLIYDSSTPFRQISFGIMMVDPRIEGFKTYRVSNKFDFSKCNSEYGLPSQNEICKKITNIEKFLEPFTWSGTNKKERPSPKEFYVAFSLSNLQVMLEWKKKCDIMINNGWDHSLFEYLNETDKNNFKIMRACFKHPEHASRFFNLQGDKKVKSFIWSSQDFLDDHTIYCHDKKASNLDTDSDETKILLSNFEKEAEQSLIGE